MLKKNGSIACDECGEFIPHEDLLNNIARHVLITPDSEFTKEEYESLCAECTAKLNTET